MSWELSQTHFLKKKKNRKKTDYKLKTKKRKNLKY